MTTDVAFQGVALLVAILSLSFNQLRAYRVAKQQEDRVEMKMRIFYVLARSANGNKVGGVLKRLKEATPTDAIDETEVRKALYEMLAERTVDFGENHRWTVAVSVDDEDDLEEEEGAEEEEDEDGDEEGED
jgi:hypothetical protein